MKKQIAGLTRSHAIQRHAIPGTSEASSGIKRQNSVNDTPHAKRSETGWERRLAQRGATAFPLQRVYSLTDSQDIYRSDSHEDSTEVSSDSAVSQEVYTASQQMETSTFYSNSELAIQNGLKAICLGKEQARDVPKMPKFTRDPQEPYSPAHFHRPTAQTRHIASGYEFDNKICRPNGMEDWIDRGRIVTESVSGDFFVVCDGHGPSLPTDESNPAQTVARFVSNNVPVLFRQYLITTQGDINLALLRAVKMTDSMMHPQRGTYDRNGVCGLPESVRCGTTMTFVFIPDVTTGPGKLHVANVGDSRAVLCCGKEGDQITIDHSMDDLREGDKKRIEKAGHPIKNGRIYAPTFGGLAMYRSLGNFDHAALKPDQGHRGGLSATPDIFEIQLTDEDHHLVVACDGVWDIMSNNLVAELVDVCETEEDDEDPAQALVLLAKKRYTRDNVSAIVVKLI